MISAALLVLLLAGQPLARTTPTPPWGPEGHRLVAELAARLLTPAVRARVDSLLGGRSMAAVADWADSIRHLRPETAPLHYVNIPLDAARYDSARDCAGGRCIVQAIADERRTLADTTASPAARLEALRFLIHFMGDLEQPLHCEDDHDRGGNSVHVTFFGRPTNLHAVWDSGILRASGLTEAELLDSLEAEMDTADLRRIGEGTVVRWAEQSHRLAVGAYEIPADRALGIAYERAEIGVVDMQLIRGGVRLAEVLNEALAGALTAGPGTRRPAARGRLSTSASPGRPHSPGRARA